jgi:hypothetical protein
MFAINTTVKITKHSMKKMEKQLLNIVNNNNTNMFINRLLCLKIDQIYDLLNNKPLKIYDFLNFKLLDFYYILNNNINEDNYRFLFEDATNLILIKKEKDDIIRLFNLKKKVTKIINIIQGLEKISLLKKENNNVEMHKNLDQFTPLIKEGKWNFISITMREYINISVPIQYHDVLQPIVTSFVGKNPDVYHNNGFYGNKKLSNGMYVNLYDLSGLIEIQKIFTYILENCSTEIRVIINNKELKILRVLVLRKYKIPDDIISYILEYVSPGYYDINNISNYFKKDLLKHVLYEQNRKNLNYF